MSDHTLSRRKLNKLDSTAHSSNQIATNIQGWIQNKFWINLEFSQQITKNLAKSITNYQNITKWKWYTKVQSSEEFFTRYTSNNKLGRCSFNVGILTSVDNNSDMW